MSAVMNPAQAEQAIQTYANEIAKTLKPFDDAEERMVTAKREWDQKAARVRLKAEGSVQAKEDTATVECEVERAEYDVAYLAFRRATRRVDTLKAQLSAAQSVHKGIMQAYGAASGRGA